MAHRIFRKTITTLMATLLALEIFFGNFPGSFIKANAASEINGHTLIAENAGYRLYMQEDNLSLIVESKETGTCMESAVSFDDGNNNNTWLGAMQSAVVITMINGGDDSKQADLVNDDVSRQITYTDNGFSAKLYWTKYKFGMTLNVALEEDGVVASVDDDSIVEDGTSYCLGTISLYPYMGNSYMDEKEGYLLVPDGNGALIYLDDKEGRFKSGFSSMIYGSDIGFDESDTTTLLYDKYNTIKDSEQIIAPVYGIAHTEDKIAYLAVIEEGEGRAQIECVPNGVSVNYNRAYAKFICRKTYTQPTSNNSTSGSIHTYESERSHSDLKVRFLFLDGENANYSGMASAYRDYLLKTGGMKCVDTAYNTRVDFLGTERESWLFSTTPVVMTTVDDIYGIYDDLETAGVKDILSVYKGWQDGGLYNLPISKYKADSKIGGTKALTGLIRDAEERGISLYLYNDGRTINPDEQNATFNVVKKINKRRYEEKTYMDVYENFLYLIPDRSDYMLSKFLKSYTSKTSGNLALAGVTDTLFSYTYSGKTYSRYDTEDAYENMVAKIDESTNLIMEQPFAYLWKNTEAFLDMPLYTSSYMYEDESVPFLSMVLKGVIPVYSEYVNFEANKQEFFLKLVETGTYPSFYITKESSSELIYTNSCDIYSSEYTTYRNTIIDYTEQLKKLWEVTENAYMVSHEITGTGVTKVTYSNGVKIYVNYSSTEVNIDGLAVSPMSYVVEK